MEVTIEKISSLLASENPDSRKQGILLAARLNNDSFVGKLTEIAGADSNQDIRVLARKALEHLKKALELQTGAVDEKYANLHFEQLLQSEDPYARFAGLKKALQQNGDIARLCILSALEKETVAQLKASMIMAAGRFGNGEDVELISEFLRDPDSRVRANAIEALASIGGDSANHYIISMMGDDDNRVKTNVIKALKGLGGPGLLELLRRMATDERVWMRASAVFAFSRIRSPQSLVILAQIASTDPEEQIRQKALAIINAEKEDGNPAAAVIIDKLAKTSPEEKQQVKQQIEEELAPVKQDEILELLRHADPCKRYLALSEITEDFERCQEAFVEAFQQEADPFLLSMMLTTIKEKKPQKAINRCIQLLKHEDDRVRANAVEAAAAVEVVSSADYIYPLLTDKNSRVAANAVIALGSIGRVDIFNEVQKLLAKGREAFRQSALYVVSLQREQRYVGLIEQLLQDVSPKVRDKAYDILRIFVNERVPGALKLLQEVELRINLEKNREHFFENSLDQLFSSLVHLIKSADDQSADRFVFERTPESEKQSLIQLARKSLAHSPADERTARILQRIDADLSNIESLISSASKSGKEMGVEEAASKMSEIELLKIERKSLKIRRDAMLVAYAIDIFAARDRLDAKTQALLRVELARVEGSLCTHVPAGTFSMLPSADSSVSEIFDLTMRLYQKHVWAFSLETGKKFLKWFALLVLFITGLLLFNKVSVPIAGLYSILTLPFFAYKSLKIFIEWKTLVTCMVDDFVHGREGEDWNGRVSALFPYVFSNALRKYFYLLLWLVVAMIIGGSVVGASESFKDIPFLSSVGKLVGLLMMAFVMASVYFKLMLIEPICILDNNGDPYLMADRIYGNDKVRFATLVIFSNFIMNFITMNSIEVMALLMPVLPGETTRNISSLLAIVSEVCLFPIIYSSVVIYTLMYYRQARRS